MDDMTTRRHKAVDSNTKKHEAIGAKPYINQNSQRIPKILENDGVIYDASKTSTTMQYQFGIPNETQARHKQRAAYYKQKANKAKLLRTSFYIVALVIVVLVCVAAFGLALNRFGDNAPTAVQPTPPPTEAILPINIAEKIEISGVISYINLDERTIDVIDASTGQVIVLDTTVDTTFSNRNRDPISLSSLSIGNVVDVFYDADTYVAENVQISLNGWEHRMIRSVYVHPERGILNIGISNYTFDESTIVVYRNTPFDITQIDPIDVVTVSGFLSRALFVEVNRSHGTVNFLNSDNVTNGFIEVGTATFLQLSYNQELRLPEGAHRLVIRGDNIEPMIREIVLAAGETIDINLEDAQYRTGILTVNVTPSDGYTLEINGNIPTPGQPIVIPLDEGVVVSVTRSGYLPHSQIVRLTEPYRTIDIVLEPLVELSTFVISTIPAGATVSIDGEVVGTSPISQLLEYGRYNVSITHEGYRPWSMQFELNEPRQEFIVTLVPLPPPEPEPEPTPLPQQPFTFPAPSPTPPQ